MTSPNNPSPEDRPDIPAPRSPQDDAQQPISRQFAGGAAMLPPAAAPPRIAPPNNAGGGVIGGRRTADAWLDQAAATSTESAAAPARQGVSTTRGAVQLDVYKEAQDRARAKAVAEQHALALAQARERAAAETAETAEARALAAATPDIPPAVRDELRPSARRDRSRYFGIHVGQVIMWEAAAVGVLAAHRQPLGVLIPVAVVAAAAVIATAVKANGRWLYQWVGLWARFHTRRRKYAAADDDAETLFRSIARGAKLETVDLGDDEMTIISHADGFTAILEPAQQSTPGSVVTTTALPPLHELLPTDDDGPMISAQVVVHIVPAPGMAGAQDAAAQSYAELTGGSVPAQRRVWIALQAQHTPDDFTGAQLRDALVNAVRRLGRKLRKSKLSVNILSRSETVAEFVAMLNASQGVVGARASSGIAEGWNVWSAGAGVHTSYRILGWPNLADETGTKLVERLSSVPTLSTTIGLAARRAGTELELEATVRAFVTDEESAARVGADLMRVAAECGARLQRLGGEQVFGVGASVPLGGFAA